MFGSIFSAHAPLSGVGGLYSVVFAATRFHLLARTCVVLNMRLDFINTDGWLYNY